MDWSGQMDFRTRQVWMAMGLLPVAGVGVGYAQVAVSATGAVGAGVGRVAVGEGAAGQVSAGQVSAGQVSAGQAMGVWTFHHEYVLGTSLQVTVRSRDRDAAMAAEAAVLAVFDREEGVLSAWRTESEFSRWERTRLEAVPVSDELMAVLAGFDTWRERTGGALDASVEAATRLWKRAAVEGRVPSEREIAETVEAMRQPHWALDRTNGTAMRLSGSPLALASFAKSWIASRAADAALGAGAGGVMLNVGGDVVVRGAMTQMVAIADPLRDGEGEAAMEYVAVTDRAVATSGGYRRGFQVAEGNGERDGSRVGSDGRAGAPEFSHLIDPRTALPVGHVLSSTVIAKDAETAGALATAFSVMPVEESERLAAATPGVEYLLVTADGERVSSAGWGRYRVGGEARVVPAAFVPAAFVPAAFVPAALGAAAGAAAEGVWDASFELAVELNLPRIEDARYRRPYVAVWIEDGDKFPVRTLALWTQNPRWLPELKGWYRDDQIRTLAEGNDVSKTVGSATRPAGKYNLKWDGKDNEGKPVKAGKYTVVVEASREHGGYQIERHALEFAGKPEQVKMSGGQELGAVVLDYRKR